MVSQPSMPRLFAFGSCLPGLALFLLFAGGCGEDEGGRCQISSDCASGLTCFGGGETGNGVCRSNASGSANDAATGHDATPDLMSTAGPETEPAEIEVEPVEAEPASTPLDAESIESGAID